MDAEYLKEGVGRPLAVGLAELSRVRPADPIEYLARWLLNYEANLNRKVQVRVCSSCECIGELFVCVCGGGGGGNGGILDPQQAVLLFF